MHTRGLIPASLFTFGLAFACASSMPKMGAPTDGPLLEGRIQVMNEGFASAGKAKAIRIALRKGTSPTAEPTTKLTLDRHGSFAVYLPEGTYCITVETQTGCTTEKTCAETVKHPEDGTVRFSHVIEYCD